MEIVLLSNCWSLLVIIKLEVVVASSTIKVITFLLQKWKGLFLAIQYICMCICMICVCMVGTCLTSIKCLPPTLNTQNVTNNMSHVHQLVKLVNINYINCSI